jgi:tetratricopeptide (TPR) repeat protein
MFFMRLRRSTKPVFIFLAVMFGLSFVVFGVGTGYGGLGDVLNGDIPFIGHSSGGGSPSVTKAQAKVAKNPNDAAAYRELATAYETKGDTEGAIGALQEYTRIRAKDVDALRELASLYLRRADDATAQLNQAQGQAASAFSISAFAPPPSQQLAQALEDPITQAVSTEANAAYSAAYTKRQAAFGQALGVYREIANARPSDPTVQLELAQTAEAAGNVSEAVGAYRTFLKLAPDDPSAGAIRQRIKQLQAQAASGGTAATG